MKRNITNIAVMNFTEEYSVNMGSNMKRKIMSRGLIFSQSGDKEPI